MDVLTMTDSTVHTKIKSHYINTVESLYPTLFFLSQNYVIGICSIQGTPIVNRLFLSHDP